MAGFPTKPGTYHLPRAAYFPPTELLSYVWPWIEAWEVRFEARSCQKNYAEGGLNEDDQAGQGFIKLLKYLRTVLLQDLAVLQPCKLYNY